MLRGGQPPIFPSGEWCPVVPSIVMTASLASRGTRGPAPTETGLRPCFDSRLP